METYDTYDDFKNKYIFDESEDKGDFLGKGGFGKCYKASICNNPEEKRAIKIISKKKMREDFKDKYHICPTEEEIKPFFDALKNEINFMKIMTGDNEENENSVKVYKYFDFNDKFVIVMEYCHTNLNNYLAERNTFSADEIRTILLQLNNSFKILNEKHIAHRDLSLDNILIKFINDEHTEYIVKLTDYGVSKELTALKKKYSTKYVGKSTYMAPEILNNTGYDRKCDLWSLGIMIHVLFFRIEPFTDDDGSVFSLLNQISNFQKVESTGNEQLDDLLSKLLEKDPNKRLSWDEYFKHEFFQINEITIIIRIGKNDKKTISNQKKSDDLKVNDINEFNDIYFLDNTPYMEKTISIYKENKEIKGLNGNDTNLYINGKKMPFQKFFRPEKEGEYIIKIVFSSKIENCSYMFSGCNNIISINLSYFDSSNVTDMSYMFTRCIN